MKVLVTGASGFTGRHMMEYLSQPAVGITELVGIYHRSVPADCKTCNYIRADLRDPDRIAGIVSGVDPDLVIHLAGATHGNAASLLEENVLTTESLLESLVTEHQHTRLLVISSSAVYGYAGEDPISEDSPYRPVAGYGISKVAEELLALSYHARYGLPVAIARSFNLAGPGQSEQFVLGRIVAGIRAIERGETSEIKLLNIDSKRDFIDVRDAVRAYWAVISHPDFERTCAGRVFNIGSGTAHSIRDVLGMIEEIRGKAYRIRATPQTEYVPYQAADLSLITATTGWRATIPLLQTLKDMLGDVGMQ